MMRDARTTMTFNPGALAGLLLTLPLALLELWNRGSAAFTVWVLLVQDQLPGFMGVPNGD